MSDLPSVPKPTANPVPLLAGLPSPLLRQEEAAASEPGRREAPSPVQVDVPNVPCETLVAVLPDDVVVPIRWIRERMAADQRLRALAVAAAAVSVPEPQVGPGMLTAKEFGERRIPSRSAEWVQDQCRAGRVAGAQKDGHAWMIPAAALVSETLPIAPVVRAQTPVDPTFLPVPLRLHPRGRVKAKNAAAHARWGKNG